MLTRVNVIGHRISSTKRLQRLFDFKALGYLKEGDDYLKARRLIYVKY